MVTPKQVIDTFPNATVFGTDKPLFCPRCDPDLALQYARAFDTAPVSDLVDILDARRGKVIERVRPVEWEERPGEKEWACCHCGRAIEHEQVSKIKKGSRANVTRKGEITNARTITQPNGQGQVNGNQATNTASVQMPETEENDMSLLDSELTPNEGEVFKFKNAGDRILATFTGRRTTKTRKQDVARVLDVDILESRVNGEAGPSGPGFSIFESTHISQLLDRAQLQADDNFILQFCGEGKNNFKKFALKKVSASECADGEGEPWPEELQGLGR